MREVETVEGLSANYSVDDDSCVRNKSTIVFFESDGECKNQRYMEHISAILKIAQKIDMKNCSVLVRDSTGAWNWLKITDSCECEELIVLSDVEEISQHDALTALHYADIGLQIPVFFKPVSC